MVLQWYKLMVGFIFFQVVIMYSYFSGGGNGGRCKCVCVDCMSVRRSLSLMHYITCRI